jgi:hypothetical protein
MQQGFTLKILSFLRCLRVVPQHSADNPACHYQHAQTNEERAAIIPQAVDPSFKAADQVGLIDGQRSWWNLNPIGHGARYVERKAISFE